MAKLSRRCVARVVQLHSRALRASRPPPLIGCHAYWFVYRVCSRATKTRLLRARRDRWRQLVASVRYTGVVDGVSAGAARKEPELSCRTRLEYGLEWQATHGRSVGFVSVLLEGHAGRECLMRDCCIGVVLCNVGYLNTHRARFKPVLHRIFVF